MIEDEELKTLNSIIENVFFGKFETTYWYLKNGNRRYKENFMAEVTVPMFTDAVYSIIDKLLNFNPDEINLEEIFNRNSEYMEFKNFENGYYLKLENFKSAIKEISYLNIRKHKAIANIRINHIELIFRKFSSINNSFMNKENFIKAITFINSLQSIQNA